MIVANMASFPARADILEERVRQFARQVDRLNLCLNQYDALPPWLSHCPNVNAFIPADDMRDVGKFAVAPDEDDLVAYVDDDIVYPDDYIERMSRLYGEIEGIPAVIGIHGVIYSDFWDDRGTSRYVQSFHERVAKPFVCNLLGTGTVLARGRFAPPAAFMAGSQRFVDVRYARFCLENGIAMIAMSRPRNWLHEQPGERETIWHTFTKAPSAECSQEIEEIGGLSRIPLPAVKELARIDRDGRLSCSVVEVGMRLPVVAVEAGAE